MAVTLPEIEVLADWLDPLDDITADVWYDGGLEWSRGRDVFQAGMPPMAGHGKIVIDNSDSRYSPYNSASVLYELIHRGNEFLVNGTSQSQHDNDDDAIARGLADPEPTDLINTRPLIRFILYRPGFDPACPFPNLKVEGVGVLSALVDRKISMPYLPNVRSDVALGMICDALDWPAAKRYFSVGSRTFEWFGGDYEDGWVAAVRVVNTEGGYAALYDGDDGSMIFEDAEYRVRESRSTTVRSFGSFSPDGSTEPAFSEPVSYDDGATSVINACTIPIVTRSAKAITTVWTGDTPIAIPANGTITRKAVATDPFIDAATPSEAGGDFTVSAGAVTLVELDRDSGHSLTIEITAGAAGATITGLRLRAAPVTADNDDVDVVGVGDVTWSQERFGYLPFQGQTIEEISQDVAQEIADGYIALWQYPYPRFTFAVNNATEERVEAIVQATISDRVELLPTIKGLGITTDPVQMWIEYRKDVADKGGNIHTMTLTCSAVVPFPIDPDLNEIPQGLTG